jgi:hypothetical protein
MLGDILQSARHCNPASCHGGARARHRIHVLCAPSSSQLGWSMDCLRQCLTVLYHDLHACKRVGMATADVCPLGVQVAAGTCKPQPRLQLFHALTYLSTKDTGGHDTHGANTVQSMSKLRFMQMPCHTTVLGHGTFIPKDVLYVLN